MAKSYIGMKFDEFKTSFNRYFVHRKKVRALENYGSVKEFEGYKFVPMLKELLNDGFLDEREEEFLEYQIEKAEIDALTWAHKTNWVKSQMQRLAREAARKRPNNQLYFDLDKLPSVPQFGTPISIIKPQSGGLRAVR